MWHRTYGYNQPFSLSALVEDAWSIDVVEYVSELKGQINFIYQGMGVSPGHFSLYQTFKTPFKSYATKYMFMSNGRNYNYHGEWVSKFGVLTVWFA